MHSHKSGWSIDDQTTPIRMYKQIRKLPLKLHLKKIVSKIYAKSLKQ